MEITAVYLSDAKMWGVGVQDEGGMIAAITGKEFGQAIDVNLATGAGMTDEEVAKRIVACWNIYEGISTEDIEARLALLKSV